MIFAVHKLEPMLRNGRDLTNRASATTLFRCGAIAKETCPITVRGGPGPFQRHPPPASHLVRASARAFMRILVIRPLFTYTRGNWGRYVSTGCW